MVLFYEQGIVGFNIGQNKQLLQRGIVANVSFAAGVLGSPLGGCHSKQSHVEHVGFVGINVGLLLLGEVGRQQVLLDGISVYAVVELGYFAVEVPREGQTRVLVELQTAVVLHQVKLELRRNP